MVERLPEDVARLVWAAYMRGAVLPELQLAAARRAWAAYMRGAVLPELLGAARETAVRVLLCDRAGRVIGRRAGSGARGARSSTEPVAVARFWWMRSRSALTGVCVTTLVAIEPPTVRVPEGPRRAVTLHCTDVRTGVDFRTPFFTMGSSTGRLKGTRALHGPVERVYVVD